MSQTRPWEMQHAPRDSANSGHARLDGVRTRRMLAFVLDYALIAVLCFVIWLVLGIATLGIAFFVLPPLGIVVALLYLGLTLGGPKQASWGMSFFSIRLERLDGTPIDFWTAIVHGVLFWAGHVALTPFLLLVSLFTAKKQLVHDLLLGTAVFRSDR